MTLIMFVLASCSKEDAKENTVCFAQCLLAKESGQDFAGYNNEERTIQNEKLNILLKRLEKQDSLLQTIKADLSEVNKQQDSASRQNESVAQEATTTSQPIDCDTRVAETTPEPAPVAVVEDNFDDYNIPEIRKKDDSFKEKAISGLVGTALGAATTYMVEKKLNCDKLDILVAYKLMKCCVGNCGDEAEKKCADAITKKICKEDMDNNEIQRHTCSSCIL